MSKEKLTIFCDHGGAYGWLCPSDKNYLGGCIADSEFGFPEEYEVSEKLTWDFAHWHRLWSGSHYHTDETCVNPYFNYQKFDQDGIELTKRLKQEIGDKFEVKYSYCWENPNRDNLVETTIIL